MDTPDPLMLLSIASLVAFVVIPLASRMIASATDDLAAQFSDRDRDLSRVRGRS